MVLGWLDLLWSIWVYQGCSSRSGLFRSFDLFDLFDLDSNYSSPTSIVARSYSSIFFHIVNDSSDTVCI